MDMTKPLIRRTDTLHTAYDEFLIIGTLANSNTGHTRSWKNAVEIALKQWFINRAYATTSDEHPYILQFQTKYYESVFSIRFNM